MFAWPTGRTVRSPVRPTPPSVGCGLVPRPSLEARTWVPPSLAQTFAPRSTRTRTATAPSRTRLRSRPLRPTSPAMALRWCPGESLLWKACTLHNRPAVTCRPRPRHLERRGRKVRHDVVWKGYKGERRDGVVKAEAETRRRTANGLISASSMLTPVPIPGRSPPISVRSRSVQRRWIRLDLLSSPAPLRRRLVQSGRRVRPPTAASQRLRAACA